MIRWFRHQPPGAANWFREGPMVADAVTEGSSGSHNSVCGGWFTGQPPANASDAQIAGWFRQQPAGVARWFRGQPAVAADLKSWFRGQPQPTQVILRLRDGSGTSQ